MSNYFDHIVTNPDKYDVTQNTDGTWTIRPTYLSRPSEIIQQGTPIDANLMNGITSQLADKASKAEVDTKVSQIVSGSPKGAYATLSELQSALPNGAVGIYITTDNGNWNYWNESSWISGGVYQSTASDQFPATNRVANGNFNDGLAGWTSNYGVSTTGPDVVTFTGNGTNDNPHLIQDVGARIVGHKYYSKINVRATTTGVLTLSMFNGAMHNINNPVVNQWYAIDAITTSPTNNSFFGTFFTSVDAASTNGVQIQSAYNLEIDLTATFGAGKEPTIEELREILSRFPNSWFNATKTFFDGKQAYEDLKSLKEKKISNLDLQDASVSDEKVQDESLSINKMKFASSTKNLFDGKYQRLDLYGGLEKPHISEADDRRMAVVQIEPNESYSISVYGEKDNFRVATSETSPLFDVDGIFYPDNFLLFNDVGRQYSFTNDQTSRFLFVLVSESGQEPLLQVEKGLVITEYEPFKKISPLYLPKEKDKANLLPTFINPQIVANPAGPRFIDYFDGKMWGYRFDGGFYYSTDEGATWTLHTLTWNHEEWSWVQRLVPTSDGEMIAVSEKHIRKSAGWNTGNVTWSPNKVVPNTNCVFPIFGFDGDGTKFIAVEYASGSPNWQYSRFVHVSLDSGNTFTQVYDSLSEYGAEVNSLTHLHAACYDRWADRFYFSEGHSPAGGLYYSEDDGATWHQSPGHRDGVLYSQGIEDREGDTNGPTVIIATDDGLVMGSDNQNNGIFGMLRKTDPKHEVVEWIYQTHYQRKGVQMFAQRGWRDQESGTVYIAFRSEWDDVPPILVSATPREAKLAYEYPILPVVGGADRFMAIAKTSENRVVANCEFNGVPHVFSADVDYPNSELSNIIKIELKKLGLI